MEEQREFILSARTGKIAKDMYSTPHLFIFGKGVREGIVEGNSRAKKYWIVEREEISDVVILGFNIGKQRSVSLVYGDEKDERVQLFKNLAYEEWVSIKNDIHSVVKKLSEFSKKLG